MVKSAAVPKRFGESLDARVAVVPNHVPLRTFLLQAGTGCQALERFVDKETVYFTGTIDESKRQKLRIRDRPNFRVELRDSPVLILSMKGRPQLTIDEVHEIILMSALRVKLPLIQMIAVGGQTHTKSRHVAHAYLQFCDAATARECVNSVDALPFKDGYVHSPQIDMQSLQESMQGRAVVWHNPNYCPPASSAKLDSTQPPPPTQTDGLKVWAGERKRVTAEDMIPFLEERSQIWEWFRDEQGDSFWKDLPSDIVDQLKQTAELHTAMDLLNDHAQATIGSRVQVALLSQKQKDFAFRNVDSWPSSSDVGHTLHHFNFETAMRRVYHFQGSTGLQRQRDAVLAKIRELWDLRAPEKDDVWKRHARYLLGDLECLKGTYEHKDERAGMMMKGLLLGELPQEVRDVRRNSKADHSTTREGAPIIQTPAPKTQHKKKPAPRTGQAKAQKGACWAFLKGSCSRKSCRFQHSVSDSRTPDGGQAITLRPVDAEGCDDPGREGLTVHAGEGCAGSEEKNDDAVGGEIRERCGASQLVDMGNDTSDAGRSICTAEKCPIMLAP